MAVPTTMNRPPRATTATRPSRIAIILAAAWMILSIAIGSALAADPQSDSNVPAPVTRAQP